MINTFLDLERLRSSLRAKGLNERHIDEIINQADKEIQQALKQIMDDSIELGVQSGVQKDSPEFINELRPAPGAFMLETESGNTDFSTPPYPNLDNLLKGAKPMKDGSGVYKVIPVGKPGNKKPIYANIFDAQKATMAERHATASEQYKKAAPKGSVAFRTATSKQDRNTKWVQPAKEKDFTGDVKQINESMADSAKNTIESIIRSFEEAF
jgi:hypothetical protein